jgi:predicted outer membrane protein
MRSFCVLLLTSAFFAPSPAFAQEVKDPPARTSKVTIDQSTPPLAEKDATEVPVSQLEREIALVRIAELRTEIDLARLAYQKARTEEVRRFASKLEALHTASCDRLERLAKVPPTVVVKAVEGEAHKSETTKPRSTTGEAVPAPTTRRGEGSSDPSIGARPDAGSLDEYNRNTVNPKADSADEKTRLRKALAEQSTPTVLDKKREVEKPAALSSGVAEPREPAQWVLIQQKVAAQRLKNARRVLAEKGGAEFDEGYLRMQIASYQDMINYDDVYEDIVSQNGRDALELDRNMPTKYMQEAESILKVVNGETRESKSE